MDSCHCANSNKSDWIIDSWASDHMTSHCDHSSHVNITVNRPKINLPNGKTIHIDTLVMLSWKMS